MWDVSNICEHWWEWKTNPHYIYIYIYIVHINKGPLNENRDRDGPNLLFVCLFVGFYDISTFVGYLTPNPFLCK